MEPVAFITTEDKDDLIVAFAIQEFEDLEVKSLILMRTPKFEFMVDDSERGVQVSHEDFPDDEFEFLEEIAVQSDTVHILTNRRTYDLDVGRVEPAELLESKRILQKMNFDQRFKVLLS